MRERKKDGLALSSHFSGSGQLCVSFLVQVKILMKFYPPENEAFDISYLVNLTAKLKFLTNAPFYVPNWTKFQLERFREVI